MKILWNGQHSLNINDSQDSLTTIEQFSYLKRQLEWPAADCIQGFSLTSKNYEEAKQLSEERFGNPQAIISAHMNVLLKLPELNNDSVSRLSSFYNTIESNICPLLTMVLNPSHYGPLLLPVISERLPDAIKLLITRKLGKNNWKILELVECIKEEVDARENCEFSNEKLDGEYCRKTTHSLVGIQKPSRRNCVFCGKSHYSDKCENITDIAIRKKILREGKLCFKCLLNGHVIKVVELTINASTVTERIIIQLFAIVWSVSRVMGKKQKLWQQTTTTKKTRMFRC